MGLRYFHKTESSTFAELSADRGHPGPNVWTLIGVQRSRPLLIPYQG